MNWAQFKVSTSSGTSIASALDNARSKQIAKNVIMSYHSVFVLLFMGPPNIKFLDPPLTVILSSNVAM